MIDQTTLDQITQALRSVLPKGLAKDVEDNMRAALRASLDRLGLVTREELDVQEAVLARTRAKLEELERQVQGLERRAGEP